MMLNVDHNVRSQALASSDLDDRAWRYRGIAPRLARLR